MTNEPANIPPATDIPPTEPSKNPPKNSPRKASSDSATAVADPPRKGTKISGRDLRPNLAKHKEAIEDSHWYWIGSLPACPVESITIGGQCFPKMEERVSKGADGSTVRAPVIGALVRLTSDNIKRIREKLPRTVVRFRSETDEEMQDRAGRLATGSKEERDLTQAQLDGLGVGKNVDAVITAGRRRPGFLVTIPTDKEVEQRRADGRATHQYRAQSSDEPCARYLFAKLCPNQTTPSREELYPPPLEDTGLEWPSKLE